MPCIGFCILASLALGVLSVTGPFSRREKNLLTTSRVSSKVSHAVAFWQQLASASKERFGSFMGWKWPHSCMHIFLSPRFNVSHVKFGLTLSEDAFLSPTEHGSALKTVWSSFVCVKTINSSVRVCISAEWQQVLGSDTVLSDLVVSPKPSPLPLYFMLLSSLMSLSFFIFTSIHLTEELLSLDWSWAGFSLLSASQRGGSLAPLVVCFSALHPAGRASSPAWSSACTRWLVVMAMTARWRPDPRPTGPATRAPATRKSTWIPSPPPGSVRHPPILPPPPPPCTDGGQLAHLLEHTALT